ncbi:helix-turn-helix domain containing protein [Paenibacillus xylanexedens]|uniref:helix-turn-helix domain containing protein n=1 Tax=Paenibacillus xylanexedens TaxID=528191 RepID=UPI0011A21720|nr:helix-turn-helix domain containing protein [Paenibacillus xylanexedens]
MTLTQAGDKGKAKESVSKIVVACQDMNFIWRTTHVYEFRSMWQEGLSITKMAEYFERPALEIILLAMDQADKGKISERPGGMLGGIHQWKD